MGDIFLQVFNMSITASLIAVAVIILRLVLKKAPKYIRVILWSFVGIRLVLPFSFESILSLLPSSSPVGVSDDGIFPVIDTGINRVDSVIGAVIDVPPADSDVFSSFGFSDVLEIVSVVWLIGVFLMLSYFFFSFLTLKRKTAEKIEIEKNVFVCDFAASPFILGVIKPQIILPEILTDSEREYVLAHERAHIKRKDHIWKPLGFLLLSVHWFNPVLWVAYYFLCRDIELSCDEKVIKDMNCVQIKGYSSALLNCAVKGKMITACPLAFGETGVKERIKTVLSYKKPAFWVIIISMVLVIVVAVGFLTDPPQKNEAEVEGISVISSGSDYPDVSIQITEAELSGISPYIKIKWKNKGSKECVFGAFYDILKKSEDGSFTSTMDNDTWITIAYIIKSHGEHEKKYYLDSEKIPEKGIYRFETAFNTEEKGIRSENYRVYIEFETEKGIEKSTTRQFSMKEMTYVNEMVSFIPKVEVLPDIRISPYMTLSVKEDDVWKEMGGLDEITLSKDNLDERIRGSGVEGFLSAAQIRAENKRAWQIQVNHGINDDRRILYVFLQQNDGSFLFGQGEYNVEGMTSPNSDSSYLRWICTLEEKSVKPHNTQDTASDGISAAVYEKITAYAGLGADMSSLFSMSENHDKKDYTDPLHLPVIKIESDGDYVAFIETVDDKLNLSDGTDEFPSFYSSTRDCTSDFFEDNVLFVIYSPTSFAWFETVSIKDEELRVILTDFGADKKRYPEKGYFGIIKISREAVKDVKNYNAIFISDEIII